MRETKVLVVCSGNICRSPLAEVFVRRGMRARGLKGTVQSAGTLGLVDRPAHPKSVRVAAEIGLQLDHKSQALTPALAAWADYILIMQPSHEAWICENAKEGQGKLIPLGPLIGQPEISDPINSWFLGTYRSVRDELNRACQVFLEHLEQQKFG